MSRTSRSSLLWTIALAALALVVAVGHVRFVPLRVIVALPLLFVVPGWVITRATFPHRELNGPARLLLIPGLSLTATICAGVLLDTLRPGMQPLTWTLALVSIALPLELVAQWRAREGRAVPAMRHRSRLPFGPFVAVTLAAAALGGLLAIAGHVARTQQYPPFTQLWMLTDSRAGGGYSVGIRSHEARVEVVSVVVTTGGRTVYLANGITLSPGALWMHAIPVPAVVRPLLATLYRNGEAYRSVVYEQPCPRRVDPLGVCTTQQAAAARKRPPRNPVTRPRERGIGQNRLRARATRKPRP